MNEYVIKSGFLDRPRKLVLADDYIIWEASDLKGDEFKRLDKADIIDFKHAVDGIVWYELPVGRQFSITVKGVKNSELKIHFSSSFGLRKENTQIYSDIVGHIWRLYHGDIVNSHLNTFYDNGELVIRGLRLQQIGIKLKDQAELISWDKVAIKEYSRYFAVYSSENSKIHSTVSHNEYGTEMLRCVLKTILNGRK